MNDEGNDKDETEPVSAPLVRFESADGGTSPTNGIGATSLDQTEPCGFVPMIRFRSRDDGQTGGNTPG